MLVRVDFNVPLDEHGAITDDTRIRAALPTMREILEKGGRPVLMSHLGRPKGKVGRGAAARRRSRERLQELLGAPGASSSTTASARRSSARSRRAPAGAVVLLENVRFHAGRDEGRSRRSRRRSRASATCSSTTPSARSHRDHASVCRRGAPPARRRPGACVERELEAFARVLEDPERPLVAILGGAKVSDKLPVIDNLLERVDALLDRRRDGLHVPRGARARRSASRSCRRTELERGAAQRCAKAERARRRSCCCPSTTCAPSASPPTRSARVSRRRHPRRLDGPRHRPEDARRSTPSASPRRKTLVWNGPMGVFELARLPRRHRGGRARRRGLRGLHGRRRRRLGRRRSSSSASPTRSTTSRPAAARRSSCSRAASCRGSRSLRGVARARVRRPATRRSRARG